MTVNVPNQPIVITVNCSTMLQSQRWLVNSCQPARRSCQRLAAAPRACGPARTPATSSALAAKLAASTASAAPAPKRAATSPPVAAPSPSAVLFGSASSAFAGWSRSRGTTRGTRPTEAGWCRPKHAPISIWSASTSGSEAEPVSSNAATPPSASAATPSAPTICRLREPRSASAPPKSCTATWAAAPAAITSPTSPGEPPRSCSTANGSATGAIEVPKVEMLRAANTRAKLGSRSSARRDMARACTGSAASRRAGAAALSLPAQRLDRIQQRGTARGVPAEEHPHRGGEQEAARDRRGRELRRPARERRDRRRQRDAQHDPGQAADPAQQHGLDQELQQDVHPARADRHADPDLARPLGHRHQQDVHDADAADQQ